MQFKQNENPSLLSFYQKTPVVGRFAPSPTGRIHAGNISSALIAWLYTHKHNGSMVLRIEDLDEQRSKLCYIESLKNDYALLGLTWDKGPYFQSNRFDVYEDVFEYLKKQAYVYPCFCSRADLHAEAAPHPGERLIYAGTCKHIPEEEQRKKLAEHSAAWRIEVPNEKLKFVDYFQGFQNFSLSQDCGDFVIRRKDGGFAYQLAVVVDDNEQGVNNIVRGYDLLDSVPQQMYLQSLLGYKHPSYGHIPLLVDSQGRRLSKRNKATHIEELLDTYKTPAHIVGTIAFRLGLLEEFQPVMPEQLLRYASLDCLKGKTQLVWEE